MAVKGEYVEAINWDGSSFRYRIVKLKPKGNDDGAI